MSDFKELDEALSLVEQQCTNEQIKTILRKWKGEKVRVSAENKTDLVNRNLREAVLARAVDVNELFDLIRSSEENGGQHIFYYKPNSKKVADLLTFDYVAEQLFGAVWKKKVADFPAIKLKPNDYKYADFRVLSSKRPKDWVLKVYGHNSITRATGKVEERKDGTIWHEYVKEDLRSVLIARWYNPDFLELRVQRNASRRTVEEWLKKLWAMLGPGLVISQFTPWNLQNAMANLILDADNNTDRYTFRDARLEDEGVAASFEAVSDQGNLFQSEETKKSIRGYIQADKECSGLSVTWLPKNGMPEKDVRTLLVVKQLNEIVVPAHCTAEEIDYVSDQLRAFGARKSRLQSSAT